MDIKIITFLLSLLSLGACINETLDPCPPEPGNPPETGHVKIDLYVEKFRNASDDPLASREAAFNLRLQDICYYLYQGDRLIGQGVVNDLSAYSAPAYVFDFSSLAWGDYTLVAMSNCQAAGVLTGTGADRNEFMLHYPGADSTADFFTCVFPFTVNCNCEQTFEAALQRAHGVVRSRFVNLPGNITAAEVTLDRVYGQKTVCGDYGGDPIEATRHFRITPVTRAAAPDYVTGTFSTVAGQHSTYRLRLYAGDSAEPVFDRAIPDTLQIERNQLTEITTTFHTDAQEHIVSFEVTFDTGWDGTTEGSGQPQ
ncbi:MAG: hypothetical protein LIP00_11865 [Parabacteroides sp.]|nr:hypothetical protein [Parabacteroides sp.]